MDFAYSITPLDDVKQKATGSFIIMTYHYSEADLILH